MAHNPTPEQATIIAFVRDNPTSNLMIEAVAGAAKTSTIVMASPFIGPEFTPLAVAFNKKNSIDLAERLPQHFTCKTLNALGHQAWATARGKRLILDEDKMYKIVKAILPDSNDRDEELFTTVLALSRAAKSIGLVPAGAPMGVKGIVLDTKENWEEIAFAKGLDYSNEAVLQAKLVLIKSIKDAFSGEIDFDDQIYMSTLFGGVYPKHHTVIVDESQDLSPLNHIQLYKLTGTRLIAVGDPWQAIYAFRGADQDSMNNLANSMGATTANMKFIGKGEFHTLSLTKSFRVPHSIGKRQNAWVPHFGTMEFLPEGEVIHWPVGDAAWSLSSIPASGAVLCRNNAPLLRLAFAMIKARRPVKILGRDIGATIATLLLKATGKKSVPIKECYALIEAWKAKEMDKAGDSDSKRDVIYDRYESMFVLLEASTEGEIPCKTNLDAERFIRDLFSDKAGTGMTTFSSIHRAKGAEFPWVLHLDPHRIPSKWAEKAERRGDIGPITQERNLNYVAETRSQGVLVLAALEDCLEVGE